MVIVLFDISPIYYEISNIRKEVIELSKRKFMYLLLAVVTAVVVVVDTVHNKDSEKKIE